MKTLLFDADPRAHSLAAILKARGHDVSVCATHEEACDAARFGSFDMLVLDWSVPEHAVAASRLARGRAENRASLVVALVAVDAREEATQALASEAEDFLERSPDPGTIALWMAVLEARVEERAAIEKERLVLRALMDHFPGNIYFKDMQSRFTLTNRAFAEYTGKRDATELIGKTDFDIFSAEHAKQAFEDEQGVLRTVLPLLNVEEKETWPDGSETWVSTSKAPLLDALGRVVGTFGISLDISTRKRAEAALRQSEERYALAVRGANDGIWDWDLRQNCLHYSARWKAMLGWSEEGIGSTPAEWFDRVHADDLPRVRAKIEAALEGRALQFEDEYRMRHQDGSFRWVLGRGFAVRDAVGVAYRMAGAQTDVTDRRAYDPLTGLPNRALFVERLEGALDRAGRRRGYLFAVLFLDLDRFKLINDSLGHLAGDQLLIVLAKRFLCCIRPGDVVARFGGDEFAILLDDIAGMEDATRIAERLLACIIEPIDLAGHEAALSGSIGIAFSATGYGKAEDLLRDADTAMYRAKSLGRARFEVFDEAMRARVMAIVNMENDLRRALDRGELCVYYQPIVSLADGELVGFEALARWLHPQRGIVLPTEFIPVAEDAGLIVPIGEWVLRESCHQLRLWHERFGSRRQLSMSVNCSARQLARADFPERFGRILDETRIDPSALKLEITESVLIEGSESVTHLLSRLKERGVKLHLDDFGTGYSSLSYLHRLPLDALKIDRSFVAKLDAATGAFDDGSAFVRSIVALAKSLRMGVIAEGVETMEQMSLLRDLHCEIGQGHLFSPAVAGEAAATLIDAPGPWQIGVSPLFPADGANQPTFESLRPASRAWVM
jgi:diguanylate cyclase (GGDEF)-like protein/PAS domain S-box-containing protein